MEFYEVLRQRRSIRGYKNDAVSDEVLKRLFEAVQLAPSACNRQPYKFLFIRNRELREKIGTCYKQPWLLEAPVIVVALGDKQNCWQRLEKTPIVDVDMGIAFEHLVLAASAEGLGTCWICAYERAKLDEVLQLEEPWASVAISPLGYPAAEPRPFVRKNDEDIFSIID